MMRICVVAHLFPARSETFVLEHVMGLVKRGCDVTVIAKGFDPTIKDSEILRIDAAGVKRVYIGTFTEFSTKVTWALNVMRAARVVLRNPSMYGYFSGRAPWALRELLIANAVVHEVVKRDFDLVHVHFGDLGARVNLAASFYNNVPPTVVTWHGYDVNAVPRLLGRDVYKKLFASDVKHTVGTEFVRQRLVGLGARESHVRKIPMGVDTSKFTFLSRVFSPHERIKILSIGRLDEVKGHHFLIQAIAKLKARGRDVVLRIGGSGPLYEDLSKLVLELGLEASVKLIGALDTERVVQEMHAAHLFALTGVETKAGKVESQGLVLQEAQATGLAVIASRVGGVPESVLDGKTGILCEPGNVEELCCAIERFIEDESLLKSFGRNGRENIEANFSNEGMHSRIAALYSELLVRRAERALN